MIDVYSIGVTLKLTDLVAPQLLKLSEQFAKVDALALQVNKRLQKMGAEAAGVRNLASASKTLEAGLKGANNEALLIERNLRGIKGAMPSGLGLEKELTRANVEADLLEKKLAAMRALGRMPGGGGGGGVIPPILPPSAPGGNGRRRGHLHGGNIHMSQHGVGIGGVGMGLADDALLPLAAAGVAVYVGHKFYESAKDLQKAKADFANMNLSQADNDSVAAKAWKLTDSVHGTTATENLQLIQDLHTATGDLNHSLEMSGAYAKFTAAASLQNNGEAVEGLVSDSIKALEHRGDKVLQDPVERDKELRMQSQVDFFTRGKVGPEEYYSMSKTGKLAYQLASPEYLYGPAAALISANSGATAGTMEMTALSSLIGGHMDKKGKGFLAGLGLWSDVIDPQVASMRQQFDKDPEYQKIVAANGGSLIQNGGLSGANAKLFAEDHNKFVLDVLVPAIQKKYGLNISDEDIARLLSQNLNRNTSNDLAFWVTNRQKVAKDTAGIRRGKDYEGAYDNYMDHTATGAEKDFAAAWNNFKTEFGETMLPSITNMLKVGAEALRSISGVDKKMRDEQAYVNQGTGLIDRMKRMWDWKPGMGEPDSQTHSFSSLPPPSDGSKVVHTTINMDGRKVAHAITPYISGPLGSGIYTGGVDQSLGLQLPGLK